MGREPNRTELGKANRGLIAGLLSVLAPGIGQIYNGQLIKGLILLAVDALGLTYFINNLYHAVWGVWTLGEVSSHMEKINGRTVMVRGDHSIYLLIEGLIVLIAFVLFVLFYVMSVKDAYRVGADRDKGIRPHTFRETLNYLGDRKFGELMLIVPSIGIIFLTVMPIIFMIMLAFTNYSAPEHVPPAKLVDWVGFRTFGNLLTLKTWSRTFVGVGIWTVVWAVIATLTCYFGGILVALLVNQPGIKFKSFWRTVFILPYAIPQVVSILIWKNMFNGQFGPINQYLSYFGLGKLPWLTDPYLAKLTVILVNMWLGIPVSMLLVLGVLTTIPRDLYEAAEVDGASPWQKFRVITMPMILFSTAPILIAQFAGNINNFNVIFLLTGGDPTNGRYQYAGSTDLLVTWLYKLALNNNKYNMASAIGIIIFIVIASFSIINYRRTKSFKEEDMIQ